MAHLKNILLMLTKDALKNIKNLLQQIRAIIGNIAPYKTKWVKANTQLWVKANTQLFDR